MAKKEYKLKEVPAGTKTAEDIEKEQAESNDLMSTLVSDAPVDTSKMKRRGMPSLIKPNSIGVGKMLQAQITGILGSPSPKVKGLIFQLKHATGLEFCMPVTGTIKNAIAPGFRDDAAGLKTALEKEIGKILTLRRNPDKMSNYGKAMFMFDVFTSDK